MKKKVLYSTIWYGITLYSTFWLGYSAWQAKINCKRLPGCTDTTLLNTNVEWFTTKLIVLWIKYVAVFAVLALMVSGVMYMFSSWEEDKTKKAKSWILWSLVGVILSTGAWYIVNLINNLNIT